MSALATGLVGERVHLVTRGAGRHSRTHTRRGTIVAVWLDKSDQLMAAVRGQGGSIVIAEVTDGLRIACESPSCVLGLDHKSVDHKMEPT
jgi:hypothetical protein